MDSSDWSNGIRYHIFDTRPDTEFKCSPPDLTFKVLSGRPWAEAAPATMASAKAAAKVAADDGTGAGLGAAPQVTRRGSHSSTFQLNLSCFSHTSPRPPV